MCSSISKLVLSKCMSVCLIVSLSVCLSSCLYVCLSVCPYLCLSVASYARPHFWVDQDETLQGDPGGPCDGHRGSDVEPSPQGPRGWNYFVFYVIVKIIIIPKYFPLDVCRNCEYFSRVCMYIIQVFMDR